MKTVYFKNILQTNVEVAANLKQVARGNYYREVLGFSSCKMDNNLGYSVGISINHSPYSHGPSVEFTTFEQATAFCDYLAAILSTPGDTVETIDVLTHNAI